METLNERIKQLRKKSGFTQLELAEKVHVTDKAVSKWETGEGNPEISILIELAKIFNVTLDYLLTGKETEKEIIVMSKIELCCKEDNIELFNELSIDVLKGKDENGKTILDYIEKYESKNIYFAFADKLVKEKIKIFDTQKILNLIFKYDDVNTLENIAFFNHNLSRDLWGNISTGRANPISLYVEKIIEQMVKMLPENSKVIYRALTIHSNEIINNVSNWQNVYTNILYYALLNDKKFIIEEVLKTIIETNKTTIEEYENDLANARDYEQNYHKLSTKPTNIISSNYKKINNYAVIAVPVKHLELLLRKGYLDEVKKINEFNARFKTETISTGLIDAEFLKKEGKASKDDIFIVSCMEYGIVSIEKLLTCNDLNLIKKAFDKYPICIKDMLNALLLEKKYKELYIFAIDNNFDSLADAILLVNLEKYGISNVEKVISNIVENIYKTENKFDVNKIYYMKKVKNAYFCGETTRKTTKEVIDEIVQELTLKLDKENAINGLTKEYFNNLLKNNNLELLIVKLCVKLEAILRCDYRYDGTFEEMIKKFSDTNLINREFDDNWEYRFGQSDYDTIGILNKLRMKRNSIVHSEAIQVDLSLEELKYCIEYISKLNKEV